MLTFAPLRSLAVSFCAVALALVAAPAAHAQVFSNNSAITIPGIGTATPYPSAINVTGFVGTPSGLRVRLKNFSHPVPGIVTVLLVAPSGQGIELLSSSGGIFDGVTGLTLTFGAESTAPLPIPLVTGTFRPAGGNSPFAAPADAIPRAASLAALIAGNPNGQWRLFVQTVPVTVFGDIAGGWELEFGNFGLPPTPSSPSTFTYQGRLEGGVTTGTVDARFSLWSHPSITAPFNRVAAPVTVSGVAVTNGLFTTPVNLGVPVPADIRTWLQVEISSPVGAPFVTLTPRQPITATPLAGAAQRAVLADFATNAANASNATNATNAANATNAINAESTPWSGLTGQAVVFGSFGVGTTNPGARMEINAGAGDGLLVRTSNSSPWALRIGNDVATAASFQTGMYVTNNGFFRITNQIASPNNTYAQLEMNGAWTRPSDARLKTDVITADGNLAAALKLRPVYFRWKGDGTEDFGLIAQEVREVLPKLVVGDEAKDSLTLNYSQLSVVAIGAIQEQQARIDALVREISTLEADATRRDADNADLKARLERLEAALKASTK